VATFIQCIIVLDPEIMIVSFLAEVKERRSSRFLEDESIDEQESKDSCSSSKMGG